MQAFDLGRTLNHGVDALKRSAGPLLVGAFIIDFLSGRMGNSGGGGSSSSSSDEAPFDWDPDNWGLKDTGTIQAPNLEGLGLPTDLLDDPDLALMGGGLIIGVLVCFGLVFLALFMARCFMLTGWYRLHEEGLLDGVGSFSTLFSGADRFGPMFALKSIESTVYAVLWFGGFLVGAIIFWVGSPSIGPQLAAAAGVVVMLALALPISLFLSLRLFMADRLLVLEAMTPMESLRESWSLTGERVGEIAIFFVLMVLLQMLVTGLSCCLCCFSFLLTVPLRAVMDTAVSEGVLVAVRGEENALTWAAFE